MTKLLFELVGPNYDLSRAEIFGVIQGLSCEYELIAKEPGILSLKTDCPIQHLRKRLGLTHRFFKQIGIYRAGQYPKNNEVLDLSDGTAAVRTRRLERSEGNSQKIKKELGDIISKTNQIDLEYPDYELFVLIGEKNYIGKKIYESDKKALEKREVKNRPYSSPISLKPRYTKALINLARPGKKARIHDPFCGTGGVLIEAGLMGLKATGGDKDKKMVDGCRTNLEEFCIEAKVFTGDVAETIPDDIDCIVTDPPYGRASSTLKEDVSDIYKRLFKTSKEKLKNNGYLSAIFPDDSYVELGKKYLHLEERHKMKVHGSLTRHFTVFKKK